MESKGSNFSVLSISATPYAESITYPTLQLWKSRKLWNIKLIQVVRDSFVSYADVDITVSTDEEDPEHKNQAQPLEDHPSKDLGLELYGSD